MEIEQKNHNNNSNQMSWRRFKWNGCKKSGNMKIALIDSSSPTNTNKALEKVQPLIF